MKYYEIRISKEYQPLFKDRKESNIYDDERLVFGTLKEVKEYIIEQYGKCKTVKMYEDTKEGNAKEVGIIKSFKSFDDKGTERHWISLNEINSKTIINF